MPEQEINWVRAILIIGLATTVVGTHFAFSFFSVFQADSQFLTALSFLESALALLLFAVIAKNTSVEDIKKVFKSVRLHIAVVSLFLCGGIFAGMLLQDVFRGFFEGVYDDIAREAENLRSMSLYQQAFVIFGKNSGVAVSSGIFAALIPVLGPLIPLLVLLMNGLMIGLGPAILGMNSSHFFLAVLPHGIFELPALVLAAAVGLKFSIALLKATIGYMFPPRGVSGREVFLREIRPGWRALKLFTVIIPLLMVAAIIEVTFSVWLVGFLGI